ncbi:MAG: hypothetical protein PHU53_07230 [Thermoplasmata archaeon]|nr:hypothetical protein [Thermoplasmata archaeon]
MANETSDRIAEIRRNIAAGVDRPLGRWQKAKRYMKMAAIGAAVTGIAATSVMTYDFITARRNLAERNVLLRSSNISFIAGNPEKKAAPKADIESVTKFNEGGGTESKVGTAEATTHREVRGDISYYEFFDSQNSRKATSNEKPERFQAGLRPSGSYNFREQFAQAILESGIKGPQEYMVYKFAPRRGFNELDIDVVEFPGERGLKENEPGIIEKKGNGKEDVRIMVNRLKEYRNLIGWVKGKEWRAGTLLEDYAITPENAVAAREIFKKLKTLDSTQAVSEGDREDLVEQILDIERRMKKNTIYDTFEDGFFKILPQESTIYLGERLPAWKRFACWLGMGRDNHNILRVENQWDLWPGRWPGLEGTVFGHGEDKIYPFDKYNNGGYTLEDKFGKIAQIKIEDFVWKYGQDVVYSYFLDLNGDGKIDEKNELISKVLCKTTHDEKIGLEKLSRGERPETDMTISLNYSFMTPEVEMVKGKEFFRLGAAIETLMVEQVHRGYGKHSLLGYIHDQRSDKMLSDDMNLQNMSRALTQESTLVAKHDIIKALIAAKRPYARELAEKYNIANEFVGHYQTSDLTRKRLYTGPWPWIILGVAGAGYLAYRRNRKDKERRDSRTGISLEIEKKYGGITK